MPHIHGRRCFHALACTGYTTLPSTCLCARSLLQALRVDDDGAREQAVLAALHAALQYAVTGAVRFRSIQCVVLCVFTLHCCRGRGGADEKQQRQAWHSSLSEALPAGDKAEWAAVSWVDPRLESHATQDRFGFEWNQRGQHPTVEAWAEAVRDDWAKFMHKVCVWGVGTVMVVMCVVGGSEGEGVSRGSPGQPRPAVTLQTLPPLPSLKGARGRHD